jgi:biotin carboxyl carrier protein
MSRGSAIGFSPWPCREGFAARSTPMGDDEKDLRIKELEEIVAKFEEEREEANQAAAARRAGRMAERAADSEQQDDDEAAAAAATPPAQSQRPAQEQSATSPASGPLAGVRVVECTHFIAGPLSGRLLADQGVRSTWRPRDPAHTAKRHPPIARTGTCAAASDIRSNRLWCNPTEMQPSDR